MYYEFTIYYKDGRVSCPTVERQEYSDQVGYCNEGVRAGWIEAYTHTMCTEQY